MSRKKAAIALPPPKDLIVLAADKDTHFTVTALLNRPQALHIRPVQHDAVTHPEHDPGCLTRADGILRLYLKTHLHAMVLFDHEGCGQERASRDELENRVEEQLEKIGWTRRVAVLVIAPELENWVWSNSPHVITELGWKDETQDLQGWLFEQGFLADQVQQKPARPKEAMEAVLRKAKKPRSSAIYRALANQVGLSRCTDAAFLKFKKMLQMWFPPS